MFPFGFAVRSAVQAPRALRPVSRQTFRIPAFELADRNFLGNLGYEL
jgi:hypothetical protein